MIKHEKTQFLNGILTIDPGVRSTGWAYWRALNPRSLVPDAHGVWTASKKINWQRAAQRIAALFNGYLLRRDVKRVVIEWPQLWTGSAKSMSSGTDGDLFKLSYLVGALDRCFSSSHRDDIAILVPPNQWKGQLSKKVVLNRIEKRIGVRYGDHEGDAVGIGLYLLGML